MCNLQKFWPITSPAHWNSITNIIVEILFEKWDDAGVLSVWVSVMLSVDDDHKEKQQQSVEQNFTDHRFHLVVHVGFVFGFSHLIRCHVVINVIAFRQSNTQPANQRNNLSSPHSPLIVVLHLFNAFWVVTKELHGDRYLYPSPAVPGTPIPILTPYPPN